MPTNGIPGYGALPTRRGAWSAGPPPSVGTVIPPTSTTTAVPRLTMLAPLPGKPKRGKIASAFFPWLAVPYSTVIPRSVMVQPSIPRLRKGSISAKSSPWLASIPVVSTTAIPKQTIVAPLFRKARPGSITSTRFTIRPDSILLPESITQSRDWVAPRKGSISARSAPWLAPIPVVPTTLVPRLTVVQPLPAKLRRGSIVSTLRPWLVSIPVVPTTAVPRLTVVQPSTRRNRSGSIVSTLRPWLVSIPVVPTTSVPRSTVVQLSTRRVRRGSIASVFNPWLAVAYVPPVTYSVPRPTTVQPSIPKLRKGLISARFLPWLAVPTFAPATLFPGFDEALIAYLKSSILASQVGVGNIGFNVLPPRSDLGIVIDNVTEVPEESSVSVDGSISYTDMVEFQIAIYHTNRSTLRGLGRTVVSLLTDPSAILFLDGVLIHCRRGTIIGPVKDPDLSSKGLPTYQEVIMFTAVIQRYY